MINEKLERLNYLNALISDLQETIDRLECWSNSNFSNLPIEVKRKGYAKTVDIPNELKPTIIMLLMANYKKTVK